MNAAQFCAEYGYERKSGGIWFNKRIVDKFITIYTNLRPEDFNNGMRKRLILFVMIDLHFVGYSKYNNIKELPPEKIELPISVF